MREDTGGNQRVKDSEDSLGVLGFCAALAGACASISLTSGASDSDADPGRVCISRLATPAVSRTNVLTTCQPGGYRFLDASSIPTEHHQWVARTL